MQRSGSNWSTALINPTTPALTRSSRSKPFGMGLRSLFAVMETRCACRSISIFRESPQFCCLYCFHSDTTDISLMVSLLRIGHGQFAHDVGAALRVLLKV